MRKLKRHWTAFKVGIWLGWKTESNWTNPVFFVLWSMLTPISSALIFYFMLAVLSGDQADGLLPYVFIGTVVYSMVGALLNSMAWAVLEDRERMGMLKFIAIAPASLYPYLWGRGIAKVAANLVAVPVTLTLGVIFLDIPIHLATIDWPLLLVASFLGILLITFVGQILAGFAMMIARHGGSLGESLAASLYLLTGAIFPITVLPGWLETIARYIPLTYWLEAMRRALWTDARNPVYHTGLSHFDTSQILLILLATTLLTGALSLPLQLWAEHRAKEKGLLDLQTAY